MRMKVAFACYAAALLGTLAFGVTYFLRAEFMPYHAQAVAMPWADVPAPFRVLILGLMKAAGAAWLALSLALAILLAIPFRRGAPWSKWTIAAVGLVNSVGALYATLQVQFKTPAQAPWKAAAAIAALNIVGLVLSLDYSTASGPKVSPRGAAT
jgi:hypothetical protein